MEGGRRSHLILVSSDYQTQKARTGGPTYYPKIPPDLLSKPPPPSSFFSNLTLHLFTRAKLSHCVGFGAGRAVLFNVFSIMLWGTCLFSFTCTAPYPGPSKFQKFPAVTILSRVQLRRQTSICFLLAAPRRVCNCQLDTAFGISCISAYVRH